MGYFKTYYVLLWGLIFLLLPLCGFSNEDSFIKFRTLSTTNGLPNNSVATIAQDNDGFVWFGTRNGLCRYDGHSMNTYRKVESDSTSLVHDIVSVLYNDSLSNRLWLSTEIQNGVSCYNPQHDNFTHYNLDIDRSINNRIYFLNNNRGELLVAHSSGIEKYNPTKDCFERYIDSTICGAFPLTHVAEGRGGLLWLSTSGGVLCFDPQRAALLNDKGSVLFIQEGVKRLMADNGRGELWYVTTNNELYIYSTISHTSRKVELPEITEIAEIEKMRSGNVWVGTKDGLFILNEEAQLLDYYSQLSEDDNNLSDNAVIEVFEDREQNVWLGTYFGGVSYYIHGSNHFRLYRNGVGGNFLSGKAVRQVVRCPDNRLLIATEDEGVSSLSLNDYSITRFEELNKMFGITSKNVQSLLVDSDNYLWIGLLNEQMHIYRYENGIYREVTEKSKPCVTSRIIEDSRGNVWTAGSFGLNLYRRELSKDWRKSAVSLLSNLFITTVGEDCEGNIWAGARHNGLCKIVWNNSSQSYEKYWVDSFKGLDITHIYSDREGRLWIGTNSNGIKVINSEGKLLEEYASDRIGSNAIKGVVEGNNGVIWFGTDKGLRSIAPNGSINSYTTSDGLPTNQFNYGAAYLAEDGKLYFGTTSGLVAFSPYDIKSKRARFDLRITNISVGSDGSEFKKYNTVSKSKELKLNHQEARLVRVEYSALNYKYGANTHYAIKLDGMESEWQNMGNYNQVSFSNLRAGNYNLLIKASSDGINWDDSSMISLSIIVLPSIWLSWVALLIYAIVVVLIIWGLYRHTKSRFMLNMQLKSEHNERVNIERMNIAKSKFFAYVSHDLKTPLTLVLSPLQRIIMQKHIGDGDKLKLQKIYSNANRMNYLIDELLTISKIEMEQMQITVQRGDIMRFIGEVSHLFDIVSEDRGIEFFVKLEKADEKVWFSPSKLEKIIYNLLSNGFKYSSRGDSVSISAKVVKNGARREVVIEVEDSGRGIPSDKLETIFESYTQVERNDSRTGFGLGLSLTKSLVAIHRGSINVESKVGIGSKFTVSLDVTENSYSLEQRSREDVGERNMQHLSNIVEESVKILPEGGAAITPVNDDVNSMLIVDDNHDMNDYLFDIFNDKYRLERAYDGVEALEKIKNSMPDIILCDVMMPRMDGVELVKLVKGDVATSHILVVMLTAKSDVKDYTEGYIAGADAYIAKPFNANHLELMLENMRNTRQSNFRRFQFQENVPISEVTSNPRDERFMSDLVALINANIGNEDFGVKEIVEGMNMSRTLIHNKIKALTSLSITYFIRGIRMKVAKEKLLEGLNVAEVAYAVGYSDPNYFTKCFKKEFNMTPSEYIALVKQ